jgi:transposase
VRAPGGTRLRIAHLFPHLKPLRVERVLITDSQVHVAVRHDRRSARCPDCGRRSRSVHSRYSRRVADQPIAGQVVVLHIGVRRFRCTNRTCPRRTFAEQVPDVVPRYARRTQGLRTALEHVGVALGGRPGQRLSRHLGLPASRATLLDLLRKLPEPCVPSARVLGVDEFATRRGRVYGTVLVDVERHRPVDLLDDRSAEQFARWLGDHQQPEIICRDRAGCYAEGARLGAPAAIQVADRWHLLANLSDVVETIAAQHRRCWRDDPLPQQPTPEPSPEPISLPVLPTTGRLAQRRHERFEQVHALLERGMSLTAIGRTLHLTRKIVRKYARASSADAASTRRTAPGPSPVLTPFLPYLNHRWQEGCENGKVLLEEIRARGYRGSRRTLGRYVTARRRGAPPPEARSAPPSPRGIAALILRPPDHLDPAEVLQLVQVCERCPELATTRDLARSFATILRERRGGDAFRTWLDEVKVCGLPRLVSFAAGLRRDEAAVLAGVTLPWSSGAVEGQNTRIKLIKRMMYGRGRFDLLKKRVLLAS